MADIDSRAGKRQAVPAILEYVDGLHASHDEALQAAFDAPARHGIPEIHLAPSEGKFLELLCRIAGARKVVEVGTLVGYSAIRLARGAERVWTIEFEEEHARVARERIEFAGLSDRVSVLQGAAAEVLPTIAEHGPFDLVFVDADKENYPVYGRWAAENLRPGGLLVGDNAYLFGNLCDERDPTAAAMREFHEHANQHFDSVCLPTPEGMVIGVKR